MTPNYAAFGVLALPLLLQEVMGYTSDEAEQEAYYLQMEMDGTIDEELRGVTVEEQKEAMLAMMQAV